MRFATCVATVFIPALAFALEPNDQVVATCMCKMIEGGRTLGMVLPGDRLVVASTREGFVQEKGRGAWVREDCLIKSKDAIAHFKQRLRNDSDDVEARCGLALITWNEDRRTALQEANEAVRRKENWITLERQSRILRRCGENDKALAAMNRSIELAPEQLQLRLWRAETLVESNPQQAILDCDAVLEHDKASRKALRLRGSIFGFAGI